MSLPRVFTIPASAPFLPTLIGALQRGELIAGFPNSADPLALANATLFLPTRRACALARDAFLDVLKTDAAVLPRIVPLGDIDEDELAFAEAASGEAGLDVPDELGGLERRMLLARLVLQWAERLKPQAGEPPLIVHSPAAALALADDLARLAAHTRLPENRRRALAETARSRRQDRAGRAARFPDRGRAHPPCSECRARDCRRLHRLHAGDREPACHHREAAARRRGAAGARYRSR
jgi:ATP-dependent helicase/nuclease subunit B